MKTIDRFWIIPVLAIVMALLTACPATEPAGNGDTPEPDDSELFSLVVFHTNDCHARIREFNRFGNTCTQEESEAGEGFGGVARRATVLNQLRADMTNSLLLDGGDQFQGTLFYSLYKGGAAQIFMNELGYDAMTLGNHEFDDGPAVLAEFIEGLNFPVVSSNIIVENEPLLADLVNPYEILEVDGHRVGIIGFTTTDVPMISKPGPNVTFDDVRQSAQDAVDALQEQGVNIIIALSHIGLSSDMATAAAVDGIDIIVGGHTHSYLTNTDDENAEGPYPVMVNSPSQEPVLIVTAKSWGWYLGHLTVNFNEDGVAETWEGEPVLLDASVEKDPDVLEMVESMSDSVYQLQGMIVGHTIYDMPGTEDDTRHQECLIGNLIADAILWESYSGGAQVAFYNGGGVRSGIGAGDITMAQVLEVLPFTDTIATLDILGSDFRDLMEYAVSRAEDPRNEGTGRFLQVAGMKFTWDASQPVGSRIVEIRIEDESGNYAPMTDDQIVHIATSGFLRGAGDGYQILIDKAIDPYDHGRVISDVVVEYIELMSPMAPQLEGRINQIN